MKYKHFNQTLIIIASIFIFVLIIIYNIFDNQRIKIVEQNIKINNLPQSFNNFTILQITDLHGKYFGKNQKKLIDKINSINYDMIACMSFYWKHLYKRYTYKNKIEEENISCQY